MKVFGIAEFLHESGGAGQDWFITRMGTWRCGAYPPVFAREEDAQRWLNAHSWNNSRTDWNWDETICGKAKVVALEFVDPAGEEPNAR